MTVTNYSPRIALGTWSWGSGVAGGDQVFGNHLSEAELEPVVKAAMAKGLNLWDTAAVYGQGSSERILGSLLASYNREDYTLSTKFTPQIAGPEDDAMERMLDGSLQRLHSDYIDLYWIHNPADVEKWTPGLIPLVKSGKVKRVGVSNHNLSQIRRAREILAAGGVELSAIQNHYSLLYRSSEEAGILDYCMKNGIEFFAYMVLEQGALTGHYTSVNPLPAGSGRASTYNAALPNLERLYQAMAKIGNGHGASIPEVATAWAINKGTLPIIGVTKLHYIDSQERASSIILKPDEISLLERLASESGVDTRGSWENPMA